MPAPRPRHCPVPPGENESGRGPDAGRAVSPSGDGSGHLPQASMAAEFTAELTAKHCHAHGHPQPDPPSTRSGQVHGQPTGIEVTTEPPSTIMGRSRPTRATFTAKPLPKSLPCAA
eukprot:gene5683-biopygen16273